jgi:hypothetical protein
LVKAIPNHRNPNPKIRKEGKGKEQDTHRRCLGLARKVRRRKAAPSRSISMRTFSGASEKKDRAVEEHTFATAERKIPSGAKAAPPATVR